MLTGSVTNLWRCEGCGYCNVEIDACELCNAPAPAPPPGADEPTDAVSADAVPGDAVAPPAREAQPVPRRQRPLHAAGRQQLLELMDAAGLDEAGRRRPAAPIAPGAPAAPMPVTATTPPDVDRPTAPPEKLVGRQATRTVAGIIVANLAVQGGGLLVAKGDHMDPSQALKLTLALGMMFYGAIAVWVVARAGALGVVARWTDGDGPASRSIARGLATGAVAAGALTALVSAADRHVVVDPIAGLLSGEPVVLLLLGAAVVAGLAPLVEELVFRGYLAEALRPRGRKTAVLISALAFAIAHLRFAELQYYALMGVLLAGVYWKRGLAGSISTHAGFNGALIVIALMAAHGPATTTIVDNYSVRLPATWHRAAAPVDWAAVGPGGAEIAFTHHALPAAVDADRLALAFETHQVPLPHGTYDATTVEVDQAAGTGIVRLKADINGHEDDAVIIPAGANTVFIDFLPNGSMQARYDVDRMLGQMHAA